MSPTHATARFAGVLYLLFAILAVVGYMVIPGRFVVAGDAAATATRITEGVTLYRVGILAALAGRIFRMLSQLEGGEQEPLELYAISHLLNRRGECSKARRVYERCLSMKLPEPIARRARNEAARLAKRERDFGRATELWNELASSSEPSWEALEQLAIYSERHAHDFNEAARLSRLALAELRRASRLGLITPERREHLSAGIKRRLARLGPRLDLGCGWQSGPLPTILK